MSFNRIINQLIEDLRVLPGVGPKSAQRMAFHLLERNREAGRKLSASLLNAMESIQHCQRCRNFSETTRCHLCQSLKREQDQLCIVESPTDVLAIEQTHSYRGLYFVLMGHISPLDGIGPDDLGIPLLLQRLKEQTFEEIILATNPTIEGKATADYIDDLIKPHNIKITRIASGVPLGAELDSVDGGTLANAFAGRRVFELD